MKKISFIFFCSIIFGQFLAQKENRILLELSTGINSFEMKRFNQYYVDSFTNSNNIHNLKIKKGFNRTVGLQIRVYKSFCLGTGFTYLYANKKIENASIDFKYYQSDPLITNITIQNDAKIFHFNFQYIIPHLSKREHFFAKNFTNSLTASFGYGYSKCLINYLTINKIVEFKSQSKFFSIAFSTDYILTRNNIFSSIGLKIGYNQMSTGVLRDEDKIDWIVKGYYPINLDFSGFFSSFVFKIGI